jgi:carboxypeptidase Q
LLFFDLVLQSWPGHNDKLGNTKGDYPMRFAFAVLLGLVAAPVAAQSLPETAEILRERALKSDIAYDFVRDLTTQVGPRLVGSPGDKRAVDWSVARLKALGFKNIQVQPFEAEGWIRGVETAELLGTASQKLVITSLGGSVATPDAGVTGELAVFRSYDEFLKMKDGSLAGKIVVITQRTIKAQDGAGYGATGRIRRGGASEAAKRGAVAYLLRSLGTSSNRFAHTGSMRYDEKLPKIPAAALSAPDAEQIERLAGSGAPLRMTLTITPRLSGKVTTHNVIADIKGSDKADEIVVIGGHLDSWDLGTGAVDDGAGVAITTGAAKLILDLPSKPRRTIRLILFGAEEIGLIGARAYVAALKPGEIAKHVVGAESDFGAGKVYEICSTVGTGALDAIGQIHKAMEPLGIFRGSNQCPGGPDLTPFREAGMPVVELQQDGRDYFDLHHTPNDTLDKIKKDELDQNVAAYAVFTWMAANLDVDFRSVAPAK